MFLSRLNWRMKAALFSYKANGFANKGLIPEGSAVRLHLR